MVGKSRKNVLILDGNLENSPESWNVFQTKS